MSKYNNHTASTRPATSGPWTGVGGIQTGWSAETVDPVVAISTHIAVDSTGMPHISYRDFFASEFKYTKWTGSSWDTKVVESGSFGMSNNICVDSSNIAHLSYYDSISNQDLKYAKWNGSAWDMEIVGVSNGEISLVLDSSDNAHISHSGSGGMLEYRKYVPDRIWHGNDNTTPADGAVISAWCMATARSFMPMKTIRGSEHPLLRQRYIIGRKKSE